MPRAIALPTCDRRGQDNLVVGMKNSATIMSARSEFDAFLFAHIGEEKNGMLLSVLSALARLDLDPWREAAELARTPRQIARQRLTSLIAALPKSATDAAGTGDGVGSSHRAAAAGRQSLSCVEQENHRRRLHAELPRRYLRHPRQSARHVRRGMDRVHRSPAGKSPRRPSIECQRSPTRRVSAATKPMIIRQFVKRERPMADERTPLECG